MHVTLTKKNEENKTKLKLTNTMIPSTITFASIQIRLYGLIIGIGILIGASVSSVILKEFLQKKDLKTPKNSKAKPKDSLTFNKFSSFKSDIVWDGLWWAAIFGIIGARIYHVIDLWTYYQKNILLIPQIWTGGLGIYGAIMGGFVGLYFYAKKNNLSLPILLDIASFGIPIGQAIGRFGNFVNQELYGLPSNLPWAIFIDSNHRVDKYQSFTHFHPLFAYEAILSLISFIFILGFYRVSKYKIGQGKYFTLYLLNYSLIRLFLEGLRINPWTILTIPTAQIISVIIIILSLFFLFKNKNSY